MKASIVFGNGKPVIAVGGVHGTIMILWGRNEYIVSRDPLDDSLSAFFRFFIVQTETGQTFDYRSNFKFPDEEGKQVFANLLVKANRAIESCTPVNLSPEFDALDRLEPFEFGGIFKQINERLLPSFENTDFAASYNQAVADMRNEIQLHLTREEIESDPHLNSFVFDVRLATKLINETSDLHRE